MEALLPRPDFEEVRVHDCCGCGRVTQCERAECQHFLAELLRAGQVALNRREKTGSRSSGLVHCSRVGH